MAAERKSKCLVDWCGPRMIDRRHPSSVHGASQKGTLCHMSYVAHSNERRRDRLAVRVKTLEH